MMKHEPELDAMVVRHAKHYRNCAQTSFRSMQDRFNIECDTDDLVRALTAFPGMAGTGETCGAVSGCIMALGLALAPSDPDDKANIGKCRAAARKFCEAMTEEFGSTDCGDIIQRNTGKRYDLSNPEDAKQYVAVGGVEKCLGVVQRAVHIAGGLLADAAERPGDVQAVEHGAATRTFP
jgi:C_GCAxxG_C_C family probable redox protein